MKRGSRKSRRHPSSGRQYGFDTDSTPGNVVAGGTGFGPESRYLPLCLSRLFWSRHFFMKKCHLLIESHNNIWYNTQVISIVFVYHCTQAPEPRAFWEGS